MKSLSSALILGAGANAIWGLAFLVPVLLADFSPIAVTLGRYSVYGALSAFLLVLGRSEIKALAKREWKRALAFATAGNIGYYFLLVQAIHYVGVPVAATIVGTIPITVSLYGNILEHEFRTSILAVPLTLIAIGIVLVNLPPVHSSVVQASQLFTHSIGVAAAIAALALWTWYGVENARWLKANRDVNGSEWSTVVGVFTLACATVALALVGTFAPALLIEGWDKSALTFLAGSATLGVLVSWVATVLWNKASAALPVGITGQLIVIETIAGMGYFYAAALRTPSVEELAGLVFLVVGVLLGVWLIAQATPKHAAPSIGG